MFFCNLKNINLSTFIFESEFISVEMGFFVSNAKQPCHFFLKINWISFRSQKSFWRWRFYRAKASFWLRIYLSANFLYQRSMRLKEWKKNIFSFESTFFFEPKMFFEHKIFAIKKFFFCAKKCLTTAALPRIHSYSGSTYKINDMYLRI